MPLRMWNNSYVLKMYKMAQVFFVNGLAVFYNIKYILSCSVILIPIAASYW